MSLQQPDAVDEAAEHAYNPRVTVEDTAAILQRWIDMSAATRAENPGFISRVYGTHLRESYDLFRAANPRGCLIFIHGGYWRMLSKDEHSFIARALVPMGYSVITVNYPLCPEVKVRDIVASIGKAILAILPELMPAERENLILSGHSAGGYLTAAMLAQDWQALGLNAHPFRGALAISGVFDLEPLMQTSMNALIRLDRAQIQALELRKPKGLPPFQLAVGAAETSAFHDQSRNLAESWGLAPEAVIAVLGCNHFTVIEQLAEPGSPLLNHLLTRFSRSDR